MKKYRPISLKGLKTYSLRERKSKVRIDALSREYEKGSSFKDFLSGLPDILAVKDFKSIVHAISTARGNNKPVILGMGAHPIKVGLSPVIIDLMEKGVITGLATNGACIVHDFELSYTGHTSEDVAGSLHDGRFGMAKETGKYINQAINKGVSEGLGIGESIGRFIHKSEYTHKKLSIFGAAYRLSIPATVHVAIGTDIIHMHKEADGASIGKGSMTDFRLFSSMVADLEGGVYINLGSAVLLPEVFLKALTVARNLGNKVENITTVNMDFIQHYRAMQNVLRRPTMGKGASYALTGHHEIMFPLLAAAIVEGLEL